MKQEPVPHKLFVIKGKWIDWVRDNRRLTYSSIVVALYFSETFTMRDTASEYRSTGKVIVNPSHAWLAERSDISVKIIQQAIAQLVKRGHLRKIQQGSRHGGANVYQVVLAK